MEKLFEAEGPGPLLESRLTFDQLQYFLPGRDQAQRNENFLQLADGNSLVSTLFIALPLHSREVFPHVFDLTIIVINHGLLASLQQPLSSHRLRLEDATVV